MRRDDGLNLEELDNLLEPDAGHRKTNKLKAAAGFVAFPLAVSIGLGAAFAPAAAAALNTLNSAVQEWDKLPSDLPVEEALPQHTILLDKNGKEFARFFSENRIDVSLDKISQNVVDALLATEDSRFYEHHGVDTVGLARALASNLGSGSRQGASTITQQLVQNILISNARDETEQKVAVGSTLPDKVREMKYAFNLEEEYTKDEILEMYLNAVYFGNGAYGVEAAARIYFDTTAAKLNTAQAAMLIGLLKNPSGYDPLRHPQAAAERRDTVLNRMVSTNRLSSDDAIKAGKQKLPKMLGKISSGCDKSEYQHFCSLVRTEMLSNDAFGHDAEERAYQLTRGGTTVTTTLDRKAMKAATKAATNALGKNNRVAAGIATIVPGTGHIAAVAQNHDWDKTEIVYANRAFQPGSSMKPIVLAAAMENGIPATTKLNSNGPYRPMNMASPSRGFHNFGYVQPGALNGIDALRQSYNVYFVKLIEKTGVLKTAATAKRLGLTTLPQDLTGREASMALGSYEVSPIDMANAYSVFASGGIGCKATTITKVVRTSTGKQVKSPDTDCKEVLPEATADTVGAMLGGPFKKGGTLAKVGMPRWPTGAKTGTTNNNSANWTVGTTRQYATAVWLGDPRGGQKHPLKSVQAYGTTFYNLTGAEVAGPIFKKVIEATHEGLPQQKMPKANHAGSTIHTSQSIPDVRGMSVESALSSLSAAGVSVAINPQTEESGFLPGTVVSQTPTGGTSLGENLTVTLTLTNGSDTNVRIEN